MLKTYYQKTKKKGTIENGESAGKQKPEIRTRQDAVNNKMHSSSVAATFILCLIK